MSILVVINEKSGKGKSRECIDKLYEKGTKSDFTLLITKSAEELTDYLEENKNFELIIVSGGDGTIYQMINSKSYSSIPIFHYPSDLEMDFTHLLQKSVI